MQDAALCVVWGQSTLGSLNPLIDANAASFDDVTTGSSSGSCGFHGGWPATKGCDAVSGVGTPNCAKLATVVTAPPWMRRARAPVDAPPPRAGGQIVCVWLGMAGVGRCAVLSKRQVCWLLCHAPSWRRFYSDLAERSASGGGHVG